MHPTIIMYESRRSAREPWQGIEVARVLAPSHPQHVVSPRHEYSPRARLSNPPAGQPGQQHDRRTLGHLTVHWNLSLVRGDRERTPC